MTSRPPRFLPILVAAVFACCSLSAQAIPKAAEHEDTPVTTGADVLRPKPSTKAIVHKQVGKKSKSAVKGKSDKTSGHSVKANHRKK